MSDILHKETVLVLNRNWQAVNVRTPAHAFCQMMNGTATALEIEGKEMIRPVNWTEWFGLPIRERDAAVYTVHGPIRIPTVIVLATYAKMPIKRPKLCARTIRERDGNRCQYTGKVLKSGEGSIDHIVPRSRGGQDSWENCVWASRSVNTKKGSRLPHEAGLKLMRKPRAVPDAPVSLLIRNSHHIEDWELFMVA